MPRRLGVLLLAASAIALLVGASRKRPVTPAPFVLDARRSLVVTDQAILDAFPFERVMNVLVARSGTHTTALHLYQQLFDTQNVKPGLVAADASHCDDFLIDGQPSFNGLPRRCPTPEGALATWNPFAGDHIPLALANRFDLAPPDGSNCGQYRIAFARKTNSLFERVHLIFEGVLPNPTPAAGLAGCRPVAQFWADLSRINSIYERRARLDQFFFTGLPGFEPILQPDHFTAASGGGIRTMQNSTEALQNRFYEFRLERRCSGGECQLVAEPDVLQNMPYARFFDGTYDTPTARRFRDAFIAQAQGIATENTMDIPREFLVAESNAGGSEIETVFELQFIRGQLSAEGRLFSQRITNELKKAGSSMSALDVVSRAQKLSCVGCHFFQGNVGGTEFYQQISESVVEQGEAGPRFAISSTMEKDFLPHRLEFLRAFLAGTPQ